MLEQSLRLQYDYNRWSNQRIVDAVAKLTPQQLNEPGHAGRGSVHETLLHLISAQDRWRLRWDPSVRPEEVERYTLTPTDAPDAAALRAKLEEADRKLQQFVGSLSDEDLTKVFSVVRPDGSKNSHPLWQTMQHLLNHGTQHRSEVAAMLTGFGQSPGDMDLVVYLRDRQTPA